MATILVIDDSATQRALAAGLLKEHAGWQVLTAESGEEAMEIIDRGGIDLVVTDLLMSPMNGLAVIDEVSQRDESIPVIVTTSMGDDTMAVQLIERGAARYVAKKRLQEDLAPTVGKVLQLAKAHQASIDSSNLLTKAEYYYELDTDLEQIEALVSHLPKLMKPAGGIDQRFSQRRSASFGEMEAMQVSMAVSEALHNAYYHGNLELNSHPFEHARDEYQRLAPLRANDRQYAERKILVRVMISGKEARFMVSDEGPGFDTSCLSGDPNDSVDLPSGRGIQMMHNVMDLVQFNDVGNRVVLSKLRKSADA
jgi:CheY-like chemotaxis protein/anti-sigma regulatory factor (Ser/Thr protein kinase)